MLKTPARIGIPRGLLYHRYGDMWKELLRSSGFEVVVSPATNESIQHLGLGQSVCDLCLPIKVLFGHAAVLKDEVDALFVPRYISVERTAYMCPKFIGLPDMVRSAIRNVPAVIDPVMHLKAGTTGDFLRELNRQLGTGDARMHEQQRILDMPVRRDYFFGDGARTIAVTGRPYLVLDSHLNKGVIRYLNSLGLRVFYYLPDAFSVEKTMNALPKWVYWSLGKEVVTSVNTLLHARDVDGIINLVNAACGPDSFMVELMHRCFDLEKKPFMSVMIDEHTADVGLHTRLEAFADMVMKRHPSSARHGG